MAVSTNQLYSPTPPTVEPKSEDTRNLADWVMRQLQIISQSLASISRMQLTPISAPPARPREGLIAPNDGTNWNPLNAFEGSKKSLNYYNGQAWEQCSLGPFVISDNGFMSAGSTASRRPWFSLVNEFNDSLAAQIDILKARGVGVSPTVDTLANDSLLDIRGGGFANNAFQDSAAILFIQSGASVGSRIPTQISFFTSDSAGGPFNHVFVMDSTGSLGVPNNAVVTGFGIFGAGAALGQIDTYTGTSGTISNARPFHRMNPSGVFTATLSAANGLSPGLVQCFQNLTVNAINSASSNVVPIGSSTAGTAILPGTIGAWCIMVNDPPSNNWFVIARGT